MTPQALTPEKVAHEIVRVLTEVIAIQKPHVAAICSACPDPCCNKVKHLFDEKDLILARVLGRPEVTERRSRRKRGCSFLTAHGCGLHPLSRPFICHRYLCQALRESISTHSPLLVDELIDKISVLERLRSNLFECYLSLPCRKIET